MKERNESLDCLKGIAILLVMLGHVQVHNHMTDPYLYDVIKSIQMPMFFLISGYLAGCGTKVTTAGQYRDRLKKRTAAYVLPFFSWLVLQHASYVPRALRTVLFQLDYGLWFLMTLFLFTLLLYTAQLVQALWGKGRECIFWIVWAAGCGAVLAAYLGGVTFLSPSLLIIYLPYYTVAYAVGLHRDLVEKYVPERLQRWTAWVCGGIFLLMVIRLDLVTVTGFFMLGIQTAASFLGCFWLIRLVLDWKDCRMKRWLSWLGCRTLEIYVLHYQFASVLNPEGIVYPFWSASGLLYTGAAFAVMSLITALLIWVIDHTGILRLFLFGKKSRCFFH